MESLQDRILDSKEQLSIVQKELLEYGLTLVSITVNVPSYFKDAFYIKDLLEDASSNVVQLYRDKVVYRRTVELEIGYASLLVLDEDAYVVKKAMIQIEESTDYSRLFDIDVFESEMTLISRRDLGLAPRTCWVCEEVAHECVRARKHNFDTVFMAYQQLVNSFMQKRYGVIAKVVGYAIEAMFLEVYTTPKPGLVDQFDNGAHPDMDFELFMRSLNSITLYLYEFAELGYLHQGELDELFPLLRSMGKTAEQAMYKETNGVNTHKGLIFLMGVSLGVIGYLCPNMELEEVIKNIQFMTRDILNELGEGDKTHGEKVFNKYQVTGVRGEVVDGFPNVMAALGVFRRAQKELSLNDALLQTLLVLMSSTEDTTILYRSDMASLEEVQKEARYILLEGGLHSDKGLDLIYQFNEKLKNMNVSPGGSADLLAMTYFFYKISH